MAYVIVCLVKGIKYYVQDYSGGILLNGLVNNAKTFETEKQALKAKHRYARLFKRELYYEVLIKNR